MQSWIRRLLSILVSSVILAGGCQLQAPIGTNRIDAGAGDVGPADDGPADLLDGGDASPAKGWVRAVGGRIHDVVIDNDVPGNLIVRGSYSGEMKLEGVKDDITLPDKSGPSTFIAKFDTKTRKWLWADAVDEVPVTPDAPGPDGFGIDKDDNIYHAGKFKGTATFGDFALTSAGDHDLFVTKRDPKGKVLWAVPAGGAGWDGAAALAVGEDGKITICGGFSGTAKFDAHTIIAKGANDLFVARLDPSDGGFDWALGAGSDSTAITTENAMAVAVDGSGHSYITGSVGGGAAFDTVTLSGTAGQRQAYVAKVDSGGKTFLWAAGLDATHGTDIALGPHGDIYVVAGTHTGPSAPSRHGQGTVILVFRGYEKSNQWLLAWPGPSSRVGGEPTSGYKIVVDDNNSNSAVAGAYTGNVQFGPNNLTSSWWGSTGFVAFLDDRGAFTGAVDIPSTMGSSAFGLVRDMTGGLYVVGSFRGTADFGGNTLKSRSTAANDGFVWYMGRGLGTF